ncbi:MAG: S-ribosylhomocysteine lyase [Paludibacteraceae bacterium]|nr:S-ribosylhomocysteine lyase [Paludibacteraceae bacterium]
MEAIASFQIDHTNLKPGIYVSRRDEGFITFDMRFTEPNAEPVMDQKTAHSLEHLLATWFRNNDKIKGDVVYVGPMGCLTGFYIIMRDNGYTEFSMRNYMLGAINWILEQTEVPATTPATCGNYALHSLEGAKEMAKLYASRIAEHLYTEYTKLETKLDNGMAFADA